MYMKFFLPATRCFSPFHCHSVPVWKLSIDMNNLTLMFFVDLNFAVVRSVINHSVDFFLNENVFCYPLECRDRLYHFCPPRFLHCFGGSKKKFFSPWSALTLVRSFTGSATFSFNLCFSHSIFLVCMLFNNRCMSWFSQWLHLKGNLFIFL